jgi:hypothetical protein
MKANAERRRLEIQKLNGMGQHQRPEQK